MPRGENKSAYSGAGIACLVPFLALVYMFYCTDVVYDLLSGAPLENSCMFVPGRVGLLADILINCVLDEPLSVSKCCTLHALVNATRVVSHHAYCINTRLGV